MSENITDYRDYESWNEQNSQEIQRLKMKVRRLSLSNKSLQETSNKYANRLKYVSKPVQPTSSRLAQNISLSPLFDPLFYSSQVSDLLGMDPFSHYVFVGAEQGLDPHIMFNTDYYLSKNPDAKENPLSYFISNANPEDSPHPLFDGAYYLARNPDVKDAGVNALIHYLTHGDKELRNPHGAFDVRFYKQANADVDWNKYNSLAHYLTVGWKDGRRPNILFDPEFYIHNLQENLQVSPLEHYVVRGAAKLLAPHPLFAPSFYCSQLEEQPLNPLVHFLENGHDRQLNPHPLFQSWYYANFSPDLPSGAIPLVHYILHGAAELRSPNILFDSIFYASHAKGVWQHEPDPLLHYLKSGGGLNPSAKFDASVYSKINALGGKTPLEDFFEEHTFRQKNQYGTANTWYDATDPAVTIVITNLSRCGLVADCLQSLWLNTTGYKYEIIVVDNGSVLDDILYLERLKGPFRLTKLETNLGFGSANNLGAKIARGKYLVLLNNDTLVTPNWLSPLIEPLLNPQVGCTGAKLVYPDGRLQEAGASVDMHGWTHRFGHGKEAKEAEFNKTRAVMYCSAAATAYRLEDFNALNGFDDCYSPAYSEDIDLCLRLQTVGKSTVYCPESTIIHYEGATSRAMNPKALRELWRRNRNLFMNRWGARIAAGEFDSRAKYGFDGASASTFIEAEVI